MHGASLRVTFPATRLEKRICIMGGGGNDGYEQSNGGVDARTNRHSGAVGNNFAHHLRVESLTSSQFEGRGRDCFCFAYDRGATTVEVHLATSFIGKAQASRNLQEELKPHDAVRQEGADEWNALLSRASVDDTALSENRKGPPGVLYGSIPSVNLSSTTRRAWRQWTGPLVALPIWRPARHARNR